MTTKDQTIDVTLPMGSDENSVVRRSKPKLWTRFFPTVARSLLGIMLLAFGISGLLNLIPPPPTPLPEAAVAFNTGMMKSGYMFPLIFGTQFVVGALLLSNRFVPLALALLAPFLVNSLAFHIFLVPAGLGMVLFLLALELYLAWSHREAFRPMLALRTHPHAR